MHNKGHKAMKYLTKIVFLMIGNWFYLELYRKTNYYPLQTHKGKKKQMLLNFLPGHKKYLFQ